MGKLVLNHIYAFYLLISTLTKVVVIQTWSKDT